MIALPLPLMLAEIFIFFSFVEKFGFFTTLGYYLLPCLLGILIMSSIGRIAVMNLQSSLNRGALPANKLLHSGAIFLSGLCFLVPSFFTRIIGVILLLPGLRHLAVWRFKIFMAKKMAEGAVKGSFQFGGAGGASGFRFYNFSSGFPPGSEAEEFGPNEEREIHDVEVLDVTPLEVTHEKKENKD
jgi:UPF0716 protein FxsA